MFHELFYLEDTEVTDMDYFKFFYFRTSPRKNSKFGVTDIPWQRLRMQQQGTDEEIQFDGLWLLKCQDSMSSLDLIEDKLKKHYKEFCLAESNHRAGHTEWFSNINQKDFEKKLKDLCKFYGVEIRKVKLKKPYTATKKSQCPLQSPIGYDINWYSDFWHKID